MGNNPFREVLIRADRQMRGRINSDPVPGLFVHLKPGYGVDGVIFMVECHFSFLC
jgi:hypothetical protein